MKTVDRISRTSVEDRLTDQRPFIVTDEALLWPAVSRWSTAYLRDRVGELVVPLYVKKGDPKNFFRHSAERDKIGIAVADYLEWLDATVAQSVSPSSAETMVESVDVPTDDNDDYESYAFQVALDLLAPLAQDYEIPTWFSSPPMAQFMWIGVEGYSSSLHFDEDKFNIIAQVAGAKHYQLFGPDQTNYLYPTETPKSYSQVDPDEPDLTKFPAYARAVGHECTLQPGEMLFLPSYWWHHVTVQTPMTINVNFWWQPS